MSETTTYKPLSNYPKNDFPLVETTRGVEKELHKIQVRFAGNDLAERKVICQMENWDPQETIPELTEPIRVSVEALKGLMSRSEDAAAVETNLQQLVDSYSKDVEPVDHLGADEYWLRLAKLLLKGFKEFAASKEISADDLNFKELSRAYNDFF